MYDKAQLPFLFVVIGMQRIGVAARIMQSDLNKVNTMPDRRPSANVQAVLLLIHLILYMGFFVLSLSNLRFISGETLSNLGVLLFWSPAILLHTAYTCYQRGRGDTGKQDREAYRDGYADAMRQLGGQGMPLERLALDDEGEQVEMPAKPKRYERA